MSLSGTITPASYKQGDTITLTVTDAPRKSTPAVSQKTTVTNPDTGAAVDVTVGWPAVPAKPFGVADANRTWALKSDDGTTAVYTSTA